MCCYHGRKLNKQEMDFLQAGITEVRRLARAEFIRQLREAQLAGVIESSDEQYLRQFIYSEEEPRLMPAPRLVSRREIVAEWVGQDTLPGFSEVFATAGTITIDQPTKVEQPAEVARELALA